MKLGDLQAMFAEALVRPVSIAREGEWPRRGEVAFTGSARLSPIEQLDVYREQFWLRHVACLAEDFPALQALVGEKQFESIVSDYLAAHPPKHFQLRHLGDKLAAFLATKDDALLADLAAVEWGFVDAFDAPNAPPLDPLAIAAIPEEAWASARIVLNPALQRMTLAYPAHTVREQHRENKQVSRPDLGETHLVIYRRDFLLYTETLDSLAYEMLDRLARGEPLGSAGDAVAESSGRREDVESNIATWFTRWSALGWITKVEPG